MTFACYSWPTIYCHVLFEDTLAVAEPLQVTIMELCLVEPSNSHYETTTQRLLVHGLLIERGIRSSGDLIFKEGREEILPVGQDHCKKTKTLK